jgi:hypothetical protein
MHNYGVVYTHPQAKLPKATEMISIKSNIQSITKNSMEIHSNLYIGHIITHIPY